MIDAIYIHSFYKEIISRRLFYLLKNLKKALSTKIDTVLFLDIPSYDLINANKDIGVLNVADKKVYVDDSEALNKITHEFQFLMNYNVSAHRNILVLESDCRLEQNFDIIINQDLHNQKKDWFIYGSTYYGKAMEHLENDKVKLEHKNHMNGVAVYRRSEKFIDFLNSSFNNNKFVNNTNNYDYLLYKEILNNNLYNQCIDSKYILNISHINDMDLDPFNLKPEAKIIHQKYKINDTSVHF